jgi:hypothetical protein
VNRIKTLVSEALTEWFGEKDPIIGSIPRRSKLIKGSGQTLEPHLHGKAGPRHNPVKVAHHHLNKAWMSHRHSSVMNTQADMHVKKLKPGLGAEARAKIHDHVQTLRRKSEKWHKLALHRSRRALSAYQDLSPEEQEKFNKDVDHKTWKKVVSMGKHDPDKHPVPHDVRSSPVKDIAKDIHHYWGGAPRKAVRKIRDGEKEEPASEKSES